MIQPGLISVYTIYYLNGHLVNYFPGNIADNCEIASHKYSFNNLF